VNVQQRVHAAAHSRTVIVGQRQHGVDVYEGVGEAKKVDGVQCKLTDQLTDKPVQQEYGKSLKHKPKLSRFIMVTRPLQPAVESRFNLARLLVALRPVMHLPVLPSLYLSLQLAGLLLHVAEALRPALAAERA
jgi:hypothetical protein